MTKILNLYAGIGGNRKLWENVDVTAVEINKDIANIYKEFFPNDKVIVADAHKYLLEHFKEFDFIWSSPPCPSHSKWRKIVWENKLSPIYPDMHLYQEIILLKHWAKCKWVIENVISYYEPLIKPQEVNRHYLWSNFHISNNPNIPRTLDIKSHNRVNLNMPNIDKYKGIGNRKDQILHNCVEPELGLHIFNCAFKVKQKILEEVEK